MQSSIEQWREKAENELAGGMPQGEERKETEPAAENRQKKFKVTIPDDEFNKEPPQKEDPVKAETEDVSFFSTLPKADDVSKPVPRPENPCADKDESKRCPHEEITSQRVMEALDARVKSFRFELIMGSVLTLLLLLLDFAPPLKLAMPQIISWSAHPRIFALLNLMLLLLVGLLFLPGAVGGLAKLFTLKADGDSLSSLAFLGALISNVCLLVKPEAIAQGQIYLISAVAAVCLLLDALGKNFETARIRRNYKWIAENDVLRAAVKINNGATAKALAKGLEYDTYQIMNTQKAVLLTDYLDNSFSPTSLDSAAHIFAPIVLIAAILNFLNEYFMLNSPLQAVIMFSVVCCIGAPLTGALNPHLPMWRACGALRKKNALLAGFDTVLDYSDVSAAVVDAKTIFPEGTVNLRGIKSFKGNSIDSAIVDAASLVCAAGGTISGVFMKIIDNQTELLRTVQSYEYEDNKGLSGWIDNRRILIGSRELMVRHGVEVPSRSAEAKYLANGWDIVYLAVSGELYALFIIEYEAAEPAHRALQNLQKQGVAILVSTLDPNITGPMLADKFGLDQHGIKILSAKENELVRQNNNGCKASASLAFTGGIESYSSALGACIKLRGTSRACSVLQIAGAFSGILVVMYIAASWGISQVTPLQILLYQAIWSLPVLLVGLLRKHA